MVLTTIRLSKSGLSPPVFLAGSFTKWQASLEMDHELVGEGPTEYFKFSKVVDLEPGEHQYKFRLGHGNWWIADEAVATVKDDLGNVNNIIQVEAPALLEMSTSSSSRNRSRSPQKQESPDSSIRTRPSSQSLASSSSFVVTAASVTSTNPILDETEPETSRAESRGGSPVKTPANTSNIPQLAESNQANGQLEPEPENKSKVHRFVRKLLWCCSRHTAIGVAALTIVVAFYLQFR